MMFPLKNERSGSLDLEINTILHTPSPEDFKGLGHSGVQPILTTTCDRWGGRTGSGQMPFSAVQWTEEGGKSETHIGSKQQGCAY